jgi:hypothetical protein
MLVPSDNAPGILVGHGSRNCVGERLHIGFNLGYAPTDTFEPIAGFPVVFGRGRRHFGDRSREIANFGLEIAAEATDSKLINSAIR